jgi:hypothetical protein
MLSVVCLYYLLWLRSLKQKCILTMNSLFLCSLVECVSLALEIEETHSRGNHQTVWIWQHDKRTYDYKIILHCVRKLMKNK